MGEGMNPIFDVAAQRIAKYDDMFDVLCDCDWVSFVLPIELGHYLTLRRRKKNVTRFRTFMARQR